MPSGPPELHEYWSNYDSECSGDHNAITYLESNGYELTSRWTWLLPTKDHKCTEKEISAINYLCWEWDFGGIEGHRPL